MEKKKAFQWLVILIGIELLAAVLLVVVFDPFYQYHGPLPGTKAVLYDRDNQVPGTIRNFSYDAVLLGSSVAENFDSGYLDKQFGTKTIKIIRSNGGAADLLHFLDEAHERQEIRQVFWCMDLFALDSDTDITLTAENLPNYYLHTKSILDDTAYLLNKEIILEKIPQMLYYSSEDINTNGHAYDWNDGKEFSAKRAMSAYRKPAYPDAEKRKEDAERWMEDIEGWKNDTVKKLRNDALIDGDIAENVDILGESYAVENIPYFKDNMEMILEEIHSHPETVYTIFFPPYSMLWWDSSYTGGKADQYLAILEYALPALLSCENVELYYFQDEKELICNLDNYMDMVHYPREINQYMMECIVSGKKQVTKENVNEVLSSMRELYGYIITEGIFRYYQ